MCVWGVRHPNPPPHHPVAINTCTLSQHTPAVQPSTQAQHPKRPKKPRPYLHPYLPSFPAPTCTAAPYATASSGLMPLLGSLPCRRQQQQRQQRQQQASSLSEQTQDALPAALEPAAHLLLPLLPPLQSCTAVCALHIPPSHFSWPSSLHKHSLHLLFPPAPPAQPPPQLPNHRASHSLCLA